MGIKREYAEILRNAGFIDIELKQFGEMHTSKGQPMDFDTIFNSATFQAMITSRKTWWRRALEPKSMGGMGFTRDEAYKSIEGYYKQKTRKRHDVFQFLKTEYRPPTTIKSKRAFAIAIASKATITHSLMGKYSTPIKRKVTWCGMCGGNRTITNIENVQQTCPKCGGSGSSVRPH
jgi:hypothetical protein